MRKTITAITATTANTVSLTAARRLREIQSNSGDVCAPPYHEYHRSETKHGFVSITIAKKSRR